MRKLSLKPFDNSDLDLLKTWLNVSHVARWYEHPSAWIAEAEDTQGEFSWIHHFIATVGGVPVGFCQFYEYVKGGEAWHGSVDTAGAYSIDYMIGDTSFLGKGYGREIIRALVAQISCQNGAKRIIVQPDPQNSASCAALLSAGFMFDEENSLYRLEL